ncbi:FAD binding domain-containing protein [Spirochaeta dissipatitropha]
MNNIIHAPARPLSLNEALQILKREPDTIILGGGTYSFSGKTYNMSERFPRPQIMSLDRIEELRRISRTERYLELGATVVLQRILQLGVNILPHPLYDCLKAISSPGLRQLATIGGTCMVPESSLGIGIVLSCLDASVELRRAGGSRKIPAARLYGSGKAIQDGELITRIRIPDLPLTHSVYELFGGPYDRSSHPLGICGTATVDKSSIESIQFVTADANQTIIRNRELETDIAGEKVPLTDKELQSFQERWEKTLHVYNLSRIQVERGKRSFLRFLYNLGK